MIAEVIIDSRAKKLNRKFDYKIPENLTDLIDIGSRVLVPFANFKTLEQGYVIKIKEHTEFEVKEIAGLDENLSQEKIELARWMARKYFCNVSECIKLMLTPGTRSKEANKRMQDKKMNFVYLAEFINNEIVQENSIDINKLRGEKQKKAMEFIAKNEGMTIPEIIEFAGVSRETINSLVKKGLLRIEEQKVERNPLALKPKEKNNKLKLTQEQQNAYNKIEKTIEDKRFEEFLLYGVTGSGKTEIYMQLIEKIVNDDKGAILLVPEISLTPQMLDRFIGRFGKEKLAVLHSKLSVGERHDEWLKIKENRAKIVIGARSAIFAPLKDLGIIIIDEEHDNSYKSESNPRYNAKEIAEKICKDSNIPLVLGSATPDLSTFYKTQTKEISLLKLTKRANNSNLPTVEVVDLKKELATGNKSMLSQSLYNSIKQNLEDKHQTILFLNRRGYSTFIICRECGYTMKCPNCNISLTYHSFQNRLKCHYCGHEEQVVKNCPSCGSNKIRYFGTGTQKLEQEIKRIFPEASTIRMDVDTVTKKNSHEEILNKFKNENIDILIGTQMVVKGHHFPKVTLVGVIAADSSLNIDDFRANERTFQILTQVAGRAGRENLPGKVIVQTYNPDSFPIEFSKKQDYDLFYKTEINLRKQLKYPPFCDIIVIGFSGENVQEITNVSTYVYNMLKTNLEKYDVKVFMPMPAPIDKIKNKYRWRIIAKGDITEDVTIIINKCLQKFYESGIGKKTNIAVDVNPNNMI
ncbi:MAG: primosomal protein N' [Clostridia bacterium]|nr:primosomal protein N' [Clostridia bacterium]